MLAMNMSQTNPTTIAIDVSAHPIVAQRETALLGGSFSQPFATAVVSSCLSNASK